MFPLALVPIRAPRQNGVLSCGTACVPEYGSSGPSWEGGGGTERTQLDAVDSVTITTLVDNVLDVFMPDQGPAHRFRDGTASGELTARTLNGRRVNDHPRGEHGFSALVRVTNGERSHSILFDAGRTPDGLSHNMQCLEVDPRDIEAVVLSHGHFDHTTGLDGLARVLGRPRLPVVIHPEFWTRRRLVMPGREPWELPSTSRTALEEIGFEIIEGVQPSFILGGCALVTGEVDRRTDFERGFPFQDAWRHDGWQPDPLVLDDQALILNLRDRGLVVLTGCGHAGVINILRYAQAITGVSKVHAIIGGFHLNGPVFEALIPETCEALAAIAPDLIVPAHCTGWRATHALARDFPGSFVPNSVGTRFELGGPEANGDR